VQLGAALVAGPQPPQVVQPRERALNNPALVAEPGAVLNAAASDHRLDAPRLQLAAVLVMVIAAVGKQPFGALTGRPGLPQASKTPRSRAATR